ncbi:hypothetical protein G6F24_017821 [Rhizopus arrhizus]|nr:hypothetical protein G6F24_017821 [Rhizopus arrhizus]
MLAAEATSRQEYDAAEAQLKTARAQLQSYAAQIKGRETELGTARANLALLEGSGQVMQDTNGDGKPDTALTPEQRTAQKGLADAAIKAYCPTQ